MALNRAEAGTQESSCGWEKKFAIMRRGEDCNLTGPGAHGAGRGRDGKTVKNRDEGDFRSNKT